MVTVAVKTLSGSESGSVDLDEATFGIEANIPLLHQVVKAQLAARRAGTHSTKTRKEVRGGGAKPWKQKGTGRARAGSTRSPIWIGGGIAHGPKPRNYAERTNKKMIKQALRCALSDRAADDKVLVVDAWSFDRPSTKQAREALGALGVEGRALVVVGREDDNAVRSFRNLPEVHLLVTDQLNAYDVLVSDYVVFSKDSLPSSTAAVPEAAPPASDAGASDQERSDAGASDQGRSDAGAESEAS